MEKKPLYINKRFREQREKLIEALKESGNVSFACKRAGISRDTYYRWRGMSEQFSDETDAAILSGKEFVNDLAHTQLIRHIQSGDMGAIKFQLANCHDDYIPKRASTVQLPPNRLILRPLARAVVQEYTATKSDASQSPPSPDSSSPDSLGER
jgi:hypothetical protein